MKRIILFAALLVVLLAGCAPIFPFFPSGGGPVCDQNKVGNTICYGTSQVAVCNETSPGVFEFVVSKTCNTASNIVCAGQPADCVLGCNNNNDGAYLGQKACLDSISNASCTTPPNITTTDCSQTSDPFCYGGDCVSCLPQCSDGLYADVCAETASVPDPACGTFCSRDTDGALCSKVIGETGSFLEPAGGSVFSKVTLSNSYANPVIVVFGGFSPSTTGDTTFPRHSRITGVTSNSFNVSFEPWDYQSVNIGGFNLSYFVVQAGRYNLGGGVQLEAGIVPNVILAADTGGVLATFYNVTFSQAFSSAPVVLTHVQTRNGADAVVTRVKDVTPTGFKVSMQEQESNLRNTSEGGHTAENISYIAITPVTRSTGIKIEAAKTSTTFNSSYNTLALQQTYSHPPEVLIAAMETFNGADTAELRYTDLTSNSVKLRVEEEASYDAETSHGFEALSYFVSEDDFIIRAESCSAAICSGSVSTVPKP